MPDWRSHVIKELHDAGIEKPHGSVAADGNADGGKSVGAGEQGLRDMVFQLQQMVASLKAGMAEIKNSLAAPSSSPLLASIRAQDQQKGSKTTSTVNNHPYVHTPEITSAHHDRSLAPSLGRTSASSGLLHAQVSSLSGRSMNPDPYKWNMVTH